MREPQPRQTWHWAARAPLLAGLALLLLGIGVNVWANVTLHQKLYDIPATAAWVASLLLALVGAGLLQRRQASAPANAGAGAGVTPEALTRGGAGVQQSAISAFSQATPDSQHSPWYRRLPYLELALVALLAGVAIFFRVYRLTTMPPGIFIDQTNGALDALAILEGRQASPFGTSWYEIPTLYVYFMLGMFKLLGASWLALVLASVVPAVLTVLAVYPLARTLFGVPTALAAMAFMAFNRWHINMSRWGWSKWRRRSSRWSAFTSSCAPPRHGACSILPWPGFSWAWACTCTWLFAWPSARLRSMFSIACSYSAASGAPGLGWR